MKMLRNCVVSVFMSVTSVCAFAATYPAAGNGTEPNVWTRNYSGVLAAAKTTGYPIFMIVVNSAGCGHCEAMMNKTVNTPEFAQMENELTFYKVTMDQAYSGGTSDYRNCLSKYKPYFNYGMFPAVVVLRSDGSAYGGFGNATTDHRSVTSDIRNMIVALAAEQGADVEGGGTPPPNVVEPEPAPAPAVSAAEWAARLKGRAYGVATDASGNVAASVVLNVTARGKATAKFVSMTGNSNGKGELSLSEDDEPQVVVGDMSLVYDENTGLWRGSKGAYADILLVPGKPSSRGMDGLYTACATKADGSLAGFATVTVKNGKGKVQGKVNGKRKVSANGSVVAVDSRTIVVPAIKRGGIQGGVEISAARSLSGNVKVDGAVMAIDGARWDTSTPQSALSGLSLILNDIKIPLETKGAGKIAAAANDYRAKFSLQPRKGTFKGNLKTAAGRIMFAGAMVRTENGLMGFGTGYGVGGAIPVWVE